MPGARSRGLAGVAFALGLAVVTAARSAGQGEPAFTGTIDEHPAIDYVARPSTDRVASLNRELMAGQRALVRDDRMGYLRSVLDALDVPVESQILVFSKTGVQRDRTGPSNPRALYFNDRVIVGYIAGASLLEIAAQDAQQGIQFYTVDQSQPAKATFARKTECLSCHISVSTLEVPGVIARSNMVARDGRPMPRLGSFTVNHTTPHTQRWGGWFVTAEATAPAYIQLGNLGNTTVEVHPTSGPALFLNHVFTEWMAVPPEQRNYPSPLSDVASLMMFDHQMHAMNLLTRLHWEARVMATGASHAGGGPALQARVDELADYLLFVGEAPLALAVTPREGLAERIASAVPRDRQGRSFAQFDLETRLMKYPCSYMIYSPAFEGLPATIRQAVYRRLHAILRDPGPDPRYGHLTAPTRAAILAILRETVPDFVTSVAE